jgi:hypothetical protein
VDLWAYQDKQAIGTGRAIGGLSKPVSLISESDALDVQGKITGSRQISDERVQVSRRLHHSLSRWHNLNGLRHTVRKIHDYATTRILDSTEYQAEP